MTYTREKGYEEGLVRPPSLSAHHIFVGEEGSEYFIVAASKQDF
jgi:hypothetical protein